MKLIVCGGREYAPTPQDFEILVGVLRFFRPEAVITGGARGVDEWAERVARDHGYAVETYKPDYGRYPPREAPLLRNIHMAERAAPDGACIAFPGNTGTAHMVKSAGKQFLSIVDLRRRRREGSST